MDKRYINVIFTFKDSMETFPYKKAGIIQDHSEDLGRVHYSGAKISMSLNLSVVTGARLNGLHRLISLLMTYNCLSARREINLSLSHNWQLRVNIKLTKIKYTKL